MNLRPTVNEQTLYVCTYCLSSIILVPTRALIYYLGTELDL